MKKYYLKVVVHSKYHVFHEFTVIADTYTLEQQSILFWEAPSGRKFSSDRKLLQLFPADITIITKIEQL